MGTADFQIVLHRLTTHCLATGTPELHLKFVGGEPTLNLPRIRTFCEMARAASRSGMKVSFGMISNGTFDLGELLPLLEDFQISLSISVDGVGPVQDLVRFERDATKKIGTWFDSSQQHRRARVRTSSPVSALYDHKKQLSRHRDFF